MIPRIEREPQKAYVARVLRAHGSFATQDALYHLVYEDGSRCSITRLAAIVWSLRDEGWSIDTSAGHGATAVYRLRHAPAVDEPPTPRPATAPEPVALDLEPVRPVDVASLPEWARAWRCSDCGSRPASEPVPLLGDLGRAPCTGCLSARYFRRAA